MIRRVSAAIAVAIVALALAPVAGAVLYFSGVLQHLSEADSGWNYWFAQEVYKTSGSEQIGFQNDAGTRKYVTRSATYVYVDKNELGIGGYMFAFVKNVSGENLSNTAYVCTC